jgi:flagellar biosynthesis/type III secretory pathway protein FliH
MTMGRVVKGFGHVVPKVTLDARAQAEAICADARARADALGAAARAEADAIRAEAEATRETARREGADAGRADGLAEVVLILAAARAEAARLADLSKVAAIALATKMAEKIVGRAVALAPEVMAEIVGEALAVCRPGAGVVRLRLHPDDLAAVESRRKALAARAPAGAALEFLADDTVGRHGCVIETPQGRVDARLEAQLAALERALAGGARGG